MNNFQISQTDKRSLIKLISQNGIIEDKSLKQKLSSLESYSVKSLTFIVTRNNSLRNIPSNTKNLTIINRTPRILDLSQLPPSIESLILDSEFNQSIEGLSRLQLTSLTFGIKLNNKLTSSIIRKIPPKYQRSKFNQPLFKWERNQIMPLLPSTLTSLTLSDNFNQSLYHVTEDGDLINYLPPSIISLTFGESFDQPIENLYELSNLTDLIFGDRFNHPICGEAVDKHFYSYLPDFLQNLSFGRFFSQEIEILLEPEYQGLDDEDDEPLEIYPLLPLNLKSLQLGWYFKDSLYSLSELTCLQELKLINGSNFKEDYLPSSLIKLDIGDNFDSYINKFPPQLQNLEIGQTFNQPLNNLPSSLQELIITGNFNQELRLPSSLTKLEIRGHYNQELYYIENGEIKSILPPSLISLLIEGSFDKSLSVLTPKGIISLLPSSLKYLVLEQYNFPLSFKFNHLLTSVLSASLIRLDLGGGTTSNYFNQPLGTLTDKGVISFLPSNLQYLYLGYRFNQPLAIFDQGKKISLLPPKLKTLQIHGDLFNYPVEDSHGSFLPNRLERLLIGDGFNQPVNRLPNSLKELSLGDSFNQLVDSLPPNLLRLSVGRKFNNYIDSLPSSLTELYLSGVFNQSINSLPSSLIHLGLGNGFNQPINSLPSSLLYLKLGNNFNQSLEYNKDGIIYSIIPSGLIKLVLGRDFNQSLNNLPNSVEELTLYSDKIPEITKFPLNLNKLTITSKYKYKIPPHIEIDYY